MQKKLLFISFVFFVLTFRVVPQINLDFESTTPGAYTASNSVVGWTISSQTASSCNTSSVWTPGSPEFSVLSTPVLSGLPTSSITNPFTVLNSPLGGNNVARLNDGIASGLRTKITQTFTVSSMNPILRYCFAGVWEDGGHQCCEQSNLKVIVYDCGGNVINCSTATITATGSGCAFGGAGTNKTTNRSWTSWQSFGIDLRPYIGSCVTVEVTNSDCTYGTHFGTSYFDAKTVPFALGCQQMIVHRQPTGFCLGSSQAQIYAPLGYVSYQWFAPGNPPTQVGSQFGGNTPILTATNALAGNVYTVQMVSASGCTYTSVDTLQTSTVSISGIGSNSTCALGASGSASIVASGSGTGYNYNWFIPGSTVAISTASYMSNLSSGVYSVNVSAIGSAACGSSAATVTVGVSPNTVYTTGAFFCNNEAYLSASPGGSNFQWYNGLSAISPSLGGTASGYNVTSPSNGQFYRLRYTTSQGCKDSIEYFLAAAAPGTLSVVHNKLICPGGMNGQIVFSITPAIFSGGINNLFQVFNMATAGIFSASSVPSSATNFTINNLVAGINFSVNAFDGLCKYSSSVSVNVLPINYSLTPASATLCPGNNVVANVVFNPASTPGQYTYTWSPNIFLISNYAYGQMTLITPTAAPGTVSTIVYTVTVNPSILDCPSSKTMAVTAANLVTPMVSSIPVFCKNSPQFTIVTTPPGAGFTSTNPGLVNGVITPSVSNSGVTNFLCSLMPGTCVGAVSGSFTVNALPILNVSGNTVICSGQSTTLSASGANSYTWNSSNNLGNIAISPTATSVYTLSGSDGVTLCTDTKTIQVMVNPVPIVSISGNTNICEGESTSLIASGANFSYNWSNNVNAASNFITPTVTTVYTVTGNNISGCSNSSTVEVRVDYCTGIEKSIDSVHDIKIYPNPISGIVFIELENPAQLILYNETGLLLLRNSLSAGRNEIDLRSFSAGIYFLKCEQKSGLKIRKLVKIN